MRLGNMLKKKVVIWKSPISASNESLGKQIMKEIAPPQKQHIETLRLEEWSSFFLTQTIAYECMKPLSDGFVWAHWDKMHVVNFWGWGFEILLRTFDSWSPSWAFSPGVSTVFSWIKRKNQKHAECFAKWDIKRLWSEQSWLMPNFSHHITTATLSLSFSFFPRSFSCRPPGALFNPPSHSLRFESLKLPLFLFLSSCLSSAHCPFISLSLPINSSSFFLCNTLFIPRVAGSVFLWAERQRATN